MKRIFKSRVRVGIIIFISGAALFFFYRALIIRTVNYEIGGIKIPSRYNIITGTVKPIKDYRGKEIKRTVEDKTVLPKKIGLSTTEVVSAQVRWAVFEQWVKEREEYKGWDVNPDVFKKAQEEFLREMESSGRKVTIVR